MSPETSATPSAKEGNHILGWVFGIIVILMSFMLVFSSVISGLAMLLLGLLLLPPSRQWFERIIHRKIPRLVAFFVGAFFFLASMFTFPSSTDKTDKLAENSTSNTNVATNQAVNTNEVVPSQPAVNANTAEVTNTTPTVNTNVVQEPVVTPPVVEEVKEEPAPEPSTQDKLWTALDEGIKTRDGYDIQWDEATGTVKLAKTAKDFWDENALVRDTYSDLVKYGQQAFLIEGVKQVQVAYSAEFTDQYGKAADAVAVEIWFDKDEFQKYEWSNFEYRPVWQQMQDGAAYYYVHAGMQAGLEADKLYLVI